MLSYRTQLAKIGITPGTPWRYRDFAAYPSQLSVAMRSMDWTYAKGVVSLQWKYQL